MNVFFFFRGPSPPSVGVTETLGSSLPAALLCTWCVWSTGSPASSSYASRASPAPCERRRTWGNSTCHHCSALMSPLLSYQPSRWSDPCSEAILDNPLTKNSLRATCFHLSVQSSHSPFPLFVPAPDPWPQTTSGTLSAIPQPATRGSTAPWSGRRTARRQADPATLSTWNI